MSWKKFSESPPAGDAKTCHPVSLWTVPIPYIEERQRQAYIKGKEKAKGKLKLHCVLESSELIRKEALVRKKCIPISRWKPRVLEWTEVGWK